jgi:type II secretory pathway pseudopilin PulG
VSKSGFLKKILSNSQAFSLVELLVTLVLNGIVVAAMLTIYLQVTRSQQGILEEKKAYDSAYRAAYYIQNMLGQAVDTRWAGNADLNTTLGAGLIRQFQSDASTAATPLDVYTLGVFWREAARSGSLRSEFRKTALYFQPPRPDSSGVLFIDHGPGPQPNAAVLDPDPSDLFFDGIISFSIDQPIIRSNQRLASVRIQYVIRSYRSGDGDYKWCPPTMVTPACQTTAGYKDIPVTLNVLLRNNDLGPASHIANARERLFDQIYFFSMDFPLGFAMGGM